MTPPGIEPRSPEALADTQLIRPMTRLDLSVVAIKKGALGLPSTTVVDFTYFISIYVNMYSN